MSIVWLSISVSVDGTTLSVVRVHSDSCFLLEFAMLFFVLSSPAGQIKSGERSDGEKVFGCVF